MILINLLPHREAARKRRREAFKLALFASFLMGLVIAGAIYWWLQPSLSSRTKISSSNKRSRFLKIKSRKSLRSRMKSQLWLRGKKLSKISSLIAIYLFICSTSWLSNFQMGYSSVISSKTNKIVTMQGMAQSNERVSELLRNLSSNTPWISKPELVEIVSVAERKGRCPPRTSAVFLPSR